MLFENLLGSGKNITVWLPRVEISMKMHGLVIEISCAPNSELAVTDKESAMFDPYPDVRIPLQKVGAYNISAKILDGKKIKSFLSLITKTPLPEPSRFLDQPKTYIRLDRPTKKLKFEVKIRPKGSSNLSVGAQTL